MCVDVMTLLAFTVLMEWISGFPRRFVLMSAVIQPILLIPTQTHGYSSEFSKISAMISPRLKPSAEKKFANWFVKSSILTERNVETHCLCSSTDLLKRKRFVIKNQTRFWLILLDIAAEYFYEVSFSKNIILEQKMVFNQSVQADKITR